MGILSGIRAPFRPDLWYNVYADSRPPSLLVKSAGRFRALAIAGAFILPGSLPVLAAVLLQLSPDLSRLPLSFWIYAGLLIFERVQFLARACIFFEKFNLSSPAPFGGGQNNRGGIYPGEQLRPRSARTGLYRSICSAGWCNSCCTGATGVDLLCLLPSYLHYGTAVEPFGSVSVRLCPYAMCRYDALIAVLSWYMNCISFYDNSFLSFYPGILSLGK